MSRHSPSKRRSHRMVSPEKAGEILKHGEVRGHPLTEPQKGLFGLIRGGGKPTRLKRKK